MRTEYTKFFNSILLMIVVTIIISAPSFAAEFNLVAKKFTTVMPDNTTINMWGFAIDTDQSCDETPGWDVGPRLTVNSGDGLTINLRNCLPEPVSIVIPGQEMPIGSSPVFHTSGPFTNRVRSFTTETAPNGGTASYSWPNLKPGSYYYHSGTHPQVQVQMGLYGPVSKDFALGFAYDGISYDKQLDLLFSEIDPALHTAVATGSYGTIAPTSTLDYHPKYFLINGEPHTSSTPCEFADESFVTGETLLLRMMNAGLREFAPMMIGSHVEVVAEGGNKYPFSFTQYSLFLQPGSTKDVLFSPTRPGKYSIIERRLNLTNNTATGGGMQICLIVGGSVLNNPPTITSDPITTGTVGVPYSYDVDATDPDATDALTFSLDLAPAGMLIDSNTGVITWTPVAGQAGTNNVIVRVTDSGNPVQFAVQGFVINVSGHAPIITSTAPTAGTVGVLYTYTVVASDADQGFGEVLTYSLDAAPAGMTINSVSGVIQWTPQANQTGNKNVIVRVTDLGGLFALQPFVVSVTGHQPTIVSSPVIAATVGALYSYDVNANDPDLPYGETLTFSLDTAPTGMTINPSTGIIQWTPVTSGVYNVTVRVTDLAGLFNTQVFSITVTPPSVQLYFSTLGDTAVPGVLAPYDDADIYAWTGSVFNRIFDASTKGLAGSADIDAIYINGNLAYMSFENNGGVNVPGLGTVQDEDVVTFNTSTNTWTMYFDGSDVGLTTANEDVDAFEILTDGSVIVSILGTGAVTGIATVEDEDLIRCVGSFGTNTVCTWNLYFDGSDIQLTVNSEDIDGVGANVSNNLYLTTTGSFGVTGLTGGGEDVFACVSPQFGLNTTCAGFTLYFDGSSHGIVDNLDAIDVP